MSLEYKNAIKNLLTDTNLECQRFFTENNCFLELGYCNLINENLKEAKEIFYSIKDNDIRASWAIFMISLIEDNVTEYPTYFELRNFLEIDLNILISHFKGLYVENIIRYADFMFTINPEVYKFIGRALYENKYEEQALFFLKRAKNYFYNDPELHYLLSYVFYNKREFAKAKRYAQSCLTILPEYFPAKNILNRISTH